MNAERLLELYEQISDAPDAVSRLRRFVLDLAVRGKLCEEHCDGCSNVGQYRKLQNGYAFKSGWFSKAGVRLLRNANVGHGEIRWGDVAYLPEGRVDEFKRFELLEGDIVLTLDRPFIATGTKVARIGKADLPSLLLQRVGRFVEKQEGLSDDYLFLWINSSHFNEQIDPGRSNGVPHISSKQVEAAEIFVPSLAEQHRIVAKVDELMALCDRLEEARKTREETRDKLTAASLARLTAPDTDPQDFPTHARFALQTLPALTTRPDQIKTLRQTILNLAVRGKLVPGGSGGMETVGTFRKLQNGYAFKSGWFTKSGMRLLRNANIGHGEIRWDETVHLPEEMVEEFERFRLRLGDVVLTLDRPFIVSGTKVARISEQDLPSLLLQRVGRFVATREGLIDDYLFLWINSPHFNEQIDPGRSNGVPHISSKQVEAAQIFVPKADEQHRIVAKVDALMALCDRLEAALTTADTTRTRLLDALLHEALEPAAATMEATE